MNPLNNIRWIRVFAALALLPLTTSIASEDPIERPRVLTGRSQQMVVIGYDPGSPWGPPSYSSVRKGYMQMDPPVVLLSIERIKAQFLSLFNREDLWRGRISVIIQGKADPDEDVTIRSEKGDGWKFKVHVPGQVRRTRFMRAMIRALLLEVANCQNNSSRLVEIPLWLQEGIAAHLFAVHGDTLVIENRTRLDMTHDRYAGLPEIRQHFRLMTPNTFAELSIPMEKFMEGLAWETYQHSSHLFVRELLRLPGGSKRLWQTIELLPGYLNKQLAFRKAFEKQFRSALDIEKWWSVSLVSFKAREKNLRWAEAKSLERLHKIFTKPVHVRMSSKDTPVTKSFRLQDLIAKTSFEEHRPLLIDTINQMAIVYANSQPDLARLIGDYRKTLMKYINDRGVVAPNSKNPATSTGKVARDEAIKQLDLLDDIRGDFQELAKPEVKDDSVEAAEKLLNRQ